MTKLTIFTNPEQRKFDSPPKFHKVDRPRYFSLNADIRRLGFSKLRTPTNRVGFVLQLGYFRATGKFFVTEGYRKRDLQYVCKFLAIDSEIDLSDYSETSRKNHRKTILALSGWRSLDDTDEEKLQARAKWFIEQQLAPRKVFEALVEYCASNKIAIPSYHKLASSSVSIPKLK